MAKKIAIMDHSTAEIHIYPLPAKHEALPEGFVITKFSSEGMTFKLSQCSWMIVDLEKTEDRLPIYIH